MTAPAVDAFTAAATTGASVSSRNRSRRYGAGGSEGFAKEGTPGIRLALGAGTRAVGAGIRGLADGREGDFGAGVAVGWGRCELGEILDGSETVVVVVVEGVVVAEMVLSLFFLRGDFGADAGCAVLAEAAGVDGWGGDGGIVCLGLGWEEA